MCGRIRYLTTKSANHTSQPIIQPRASHDSELTIVGNGNSRPWFNIMNWKSKEYLNTGLPLHNSKIHIQNTFHSTSVTIKTQLQSPLKPLNQITTQPKQTVHSVLKPHKKKQYAISNTNHPSNARRSSTVNPPIHNRCSTTVTDSGTRPPSSTRTTRLRRTLQTTCAPSHVVSYSPP